MTDTKLELLRSAGELFAEKGVDAVSLREITERSKANIASVNYHFGSREGLVWSLVSMHLQPLWEERQVRMDAAERKWGGKAMPLEEVVDLWVRPLGGLAKRSGIGESLSMRLTGRLLTMPEANFSDEVREIEAAVTSRYLKSLVKSVPGVPVEELGWRVDWLNGGLARMLVRLGGVDGLSLERLDAGCSALVRFGIAGMRAGVPERTVGKASGKGPQEIFDF